MPDHKSAQKLLQCVVNGKTETLTVNQWRKSLLSSLVMEMLLYSPQRPAQRFLNWHLIHSVSVLFFFFLLFIFQKHFFFAKQKFSGWPKMWWSLPGWLPFEASEHVCKRVWEIWEAWPAILWPSWQFYCDRVWKSDRKEVQKTEHNPKKTQKHH